MFPACFGAFFQHLTHKVRPGNTLRIGKAVLAAVGRKRAAVRQGHYRAVLHGTVFGALISRDRGVYIGYTNILAPPAFKILLQKLQSLSHIHRRNVYS